ncbi:MAG: hypothetical protein KDA66_03085 [Planctomycetaceae bacterium]|nr:hypothetical protein [Planctomycetaceae bacterium]
MNRRNGILTALCIVGVVLAFMGALACLLGIAGVLLQASGQQLGPPPQPELLEFQEKWFPITTSILGLRIVVVALLFLGCVSALNEFPNARRRFLTAMWAGLLFELLIIYPTVSMQMQIIEFMKEDLLRQQQGMPPNFSPDQFFEMVKGLSIAMGVTWSLLKAGYYSWGIMYASSASSDDVLKERFSAMADRDIDDDEFDEEDFIDPGDVKSTPPNDDVYSD